MSGTRPLRFLSPLHRATRQIALHLKKPCGRAGVSGAEGHLVTYLRSYGPCRVGTLARVFGHQPSTLTSLLDRLESRALIRREVDAEDRRSFKVSLTAAGGRAADQLRQALERLEAEISARLKPAELAGFQAVMSAIAEITRIEVNPTTPTRKGVKP